MYLFYLNAKKRKRKQDIIDAHPGIDPGHLVPTSDTLTTRRARLEITVHIGQIIRVLKNIDHIRVRIQGNKVKKRNCVYCLRFRLIYLSVFGTKTSSSDKGSIDISDTF